MWEPAVSGTGKVHDCTYPKLQAYLPIKFVLPAPGGGPGGNIASANVLEREWTKQYWKDCIDMGLEMDDCKTLLLCMWMVYLWNKKEGCMEMYHGKHLRSCRIWSKKMA